jgi:hypothetical protein
VENPEKESRVRKTKSFRQECPFQVYLALALEGQALEVMCITEEHDHPWQRALSEECKIEILDAIKLKTNTKLLQQNVVGTTGKRITLKDIANFRQKC